MSDRAATRTSEPPPDADREGEGEDANGIDFGVLPGLIGYQVRKTQIALFADFARATAGFDLSPGQFGLLVLIERNPGITAVKLAGAIGMDKSSLTPVLNKLEKRGLVTRTRSRADKRSFHIALSDDGRSLLGDMTRAVRAHEDRLARALGAGRAETLLGLLAEAEDVLRVRAETGRSGAP